MSDAQHAAIDLLDDILRRPSVMYAMHLAPGDMQLLNSHVTLHSRTEFEDHDDPAAKRLLFRLWLAPPDARALRRLGGPATAALPPAPYAAASGARPMTRTRRAFEQPQAPALGTLLKPKPDV